MSPIDPADYRELFAVTSRLRDLKNSPKDISWSEHTKILHELCGSLTVALNNGIEAVLQSNVANDPNTQANARRIISDLNVFTAFLKFEKDVLVKCGVEPTTADDIVNAIRPLQRELRKATFDPRQAFILMKALRDDACKAASGARGAMDRAKAAADDRRRTMKTYGVATIVANLSSIAVTLGSSAPFATISAGAGGLLLTLRSDVKNPPDHPPH